MSTAAPATQKIPRMFRLLHGGHAGDGTVDDDENKYYYADGSGEGNKVRSTNNLLKFNREGHVKFEEVIITGGLNFTSETARDEYIAELEKQLAALKGTSVTTADLPQETALSAGTGLTEETDTVSENAKVYEAMTAADLKAHAAENGINLGTARTKAEIIAALVEFDRKAALTT